MHCTIDIYNVPTSHGVILFSGYGTIGKKSGAGMPSMMDEMQKTLARRRAKVMCVCVREREKIRACVYVCRGLQRNSKGRGHKLYWIMNQDSEFVLNSDRKYCQ